MHPSRPRPILLHPSASSCRSMFCPFASGPGLHPEVRPVMDMLADTDSDPHGSQAAGVDSLDITQDLITALERSPSIFCPFTHDADF
ncbi:putative multifunctional siroheme biosynthesis protein HemA, partial [Dissostichus eleginoides]